MSWHYLQGQAEASSEAICWDGERFAPSSGRTTLGGYCLPDSETESSHDSQSGTMCRHSTASRGEVESMSSAGDSLARTFPVLEKARESLAKDLGCGRTWQGSSVKLSQSGCWLKIAHSLLPEDSTPFCGTWPKWGTMRNGECLERWTLEHRTKEIVSGLWPTMVCTQIAENYKDCIARRIASGNPKNIGKRQANNLTMRVQMEENNGDIIPGKFLNPRWIEWFMGFPIGWTSQKPLEIARFHLWRR